MKRLPVLASRRGELMPGEFALLQLPPWHGRKSNLSKVIVVAMPLPSRHDGGRLAFHGTEATLADFVTLPSGEVYGMTFGIVRREILSLSRTPGRWTALISEGLSVP